MLPWRMLKYLFKNKQKSCLHRTHPSSLAYVTLQQVWRKLLLFYAFFCSNCLLSTDIPCVFVYLYLVLVTGNVYGILMWTSKYQSEPESYWSFHKSIGFLLTARSYFCAGAHAHAGFYTWRRWETYFLNCLRKIPMFIPLLESKMLIWKTEE